jgi:hypothetical protein
VSPGRGKTSRAGVRRRPGYFFAFYRGEKVVEVRDRMRDRLAQGTALRFEK